MLASLLVATLVGQPVAKCHAAQLSPGEHERWPVKIGTLLIPSANASAGVDYPQMAQLDMVKGVCKNDSRYQSALLPATLQHSGHQEGDRIRVQGWLQLVAYESDGDYHLQITKAKTPRAAPCVIVEIPDPAQAPTPELKAAFLSARQWVNQTALGGNAPAQGEKRTTKVPILVEVEGQLFYDDAHVGQNSKPEPRGKALTGGAKEPASTLWELHPVTMIKQVGGP
jgi:hypothetical protein